MDTFKDLKRNYSIGIFDSGIGGLTVANAIFKRFPNEKIIYFGDTAHLPYGDKSADSIRFYSLKISKFLLEQNCKMIVIACNSASSAAYDTLLEFFDGKALFVNVVDPLVHSVSYQGFSKVGVIATKATVRSGIYKQKLRTINPDLEVVQLATPLFAPMIEEGFHKNNLSKAVIENYLSHESLKDIDALLLACTHYPLIKESIDQFFDGKIKIFDSTDVVAEVVEKKLAENNLLAETNNGSHAFYVSEYTDSFEATTKVFCNRELELIEKPIWQ